jgi:anti-sigma-K factor RskA
MTNGWRSLLAWSAAALLVAVIAVTFVLWGTNGPAYIVDMIAAYCL